MDFLASLPGLIVEHPFAAVGVLFILLGAWSVLGILLHLERDDRRNQRRNRNRYGR